MTPSRPGPGAPRRWGAGTALLDDDEARRRLVAATARCIAHRGTARITVDEVATEAGVARSTVYRYFATREELVLGVLLTGIDAWLAKTVRSLRHADDAARSITDIVMRSLSFVPADPINLALFSTDDGWFLNSLEMRSERFVDQLHLHIGPLLERWQASGQLYADLDLRETTRWTNTVALLLMSPPWSDRSTRAKRSFVERYLVRALVPPADAP